MPKKDLTKEIFVSNLRDAFTEQSVKLDIELQKLDIKKLLDKKKKDKELIEKIKEKKKSNKYDSFFSSDSDENSKLSDSFTEQSVKLDIERQKLDIKKLLEEKKKIKEMLERAKAKKKSKKYESSSESDSDKESNTNLTDFFTEQSVKLDIERQKLDIKNLIKSVDKKKELLEKIKAKKNISSDSDSSKNKDGKAMSSMIEKAKSSSKFLKGKLSETLSDIKSSKKLKPIIKKLYSDEKISEEKYKKLLTYLLDDEYDKVFKVLKKFPDYYKEEESSSESESDSDDDRKKRMAKRKAMK